MEFVQHLALWLSLNYLELVAIVLGVLSVAEMIVRLTPTTADDGAVERVGLFIRKAMDMLKIPNIKK